MEPVNVARYVKYNVQKYMLIYVNVRSFVHTLHSWSSLEWKKKKKK